MAYNYLYYMEPDNFPCRSQWLDRMYEEAVLDGDFWMKGITSPFLVRPAAHLQTTPVELGSTGSIIRDGSPLIGTYTFADHINGNAFYRLDSPQFATFLSK